MLFNAKSMGPVYAKISGSKYADFTIISIFRTKFGVLTHGYSFSRLLLLEYGVVLKRTECFWFLVTTTLSLHGSVWPPGYLWA